MNNIIIVMASLLSLMQTTVNGKYRGEVYRTNYCQGTCIVSHVFGREAEIPVKEVWVNIWDNNISIGAKTEKPVIEGSIRDNYYHRGLSGTLNNQNNLEGRPERIITLNNIEKYITKEGEILVAKSATIILRNKKPLYAYFTETKYGKHIRSIHYWGIFND